MRGCASRSSGRGNHPCTLSLRKKMRSYGPVEVKGGRTILLARYFTAEETRGSVERGQPLVKGLARLNFQAGGVAKRIGAKFRDGKRGGRDFARVPDEPLLETSGGCLRMELEAECVGDP